MKIQELTTEFFSSLNEFGKGNYIEDTYFKVNENNYVRIVCYQTTMNDWYIELQINRNEKFISMSSMDLGKISFDDAMKELEKYPFYDTTEEECQERINKFNNVCGGCGEKPTPIETVNNSDVPTFWSGCNQCGRFTSGVPLMVFKTANAMYDTGKRCNYAIEKQQHISSISSDVWTVICAYEKAIRLKIGTVFFDKQNTCYSKKAKNIWFYIDKDDALKKVYMTDKEAHKKSVRFDFDLVIDRYE